MHDQQMHILLKFALATQEHFSITVSYSGLLVEVRGREIHSVQVHFLPCCLKLHTDYRRIADSASMF